MRRFPPREQPPERPLRRDLPRPEGPFDRLLKRRPERDPAPIIIGGTIAFLAIVIVLVFVFSKVFGGGGGNGSDGGTIDIAPGIKGRLAQIPGLPPGLVAVSDFVEFQVQQDVPAIIGLPLREKLVEPAGLGFYTYFDGRWQRLADVAVRQDGNVGEGDFGAVPKNLAVLKVVAQPYQLAGSLPAGGTLHPDAKLNIVSPRDYSPAADGSVRGTATKVSSEGVLLMPTIVGSSEESARVVNDILKDESLRGQHVQAIAALVKDGDLDGIDLEYPSVEVDLASEFTQFVTTLADSLHGSTKRLSLTLPPPTDKRQAYEWQKLGKAVDIIKILPIADPVAYWATMPGALGQIVQDVERTKVMLVISPFSIEAGGVTRPLGYLQAMVLAAEAAVREPNPDDVKPGATVKLVAKNLDEGEGASPLRWSEEAAAVSFALGGTERKRIFIENSFSVGFKLELVQAYGLGGLAVADASSQSDVANIWPTVNDLARSATVSLKRPNDTTLLPVWQAPDGGDLGAGAGTSATWVAPNVGTYNIVLVVSDGERRFGRKLAVEVKKGTGPSASPLVTFAPESPTPTASPRASGSPTPKAKATVAAQVGKRADGDDSDSVFTNDELTTPGSTVTYLVTIDNDSDVPVTISSLVDDKYDNIKCLDTGGEEVIGATLGPDDGDGADLDGGADQIQCTFTAKAPTSSGKTVKDTITLQVKDEEGKSATDSDDASITTK